MRVEIPSQLNSEDVKTLKAFRDLFDSYTYLEIGSYLGGSLYPHLLNPSCRRAISVDTRRTGQIRDERNIDYAYSATTLDMLQLFHQQGIPIKRLITIDGLIDIVPDCDIDLIFVDGEHTNAAVQHDAEQCLRFNPRFILFHDDWIVHEGLEAVAESFRDKELDFEMCKIAGCDITAIAFGTAGEQLKKFSTVPWIGFANNAKVRLKLTQ